MRHNKILEFTKSSLNKIVKCTSFVCISFNTVVPLFHFKVPLVDSIKSYKITFPVLLGK